MLASAIPIMLATQADDFGHLKYSGSDVTKIDERLEIVIREAVRRLVRRTKFVLTPTQAHLSDSLSSSPCFR